MENTATQNYPGSVASYDTRPGNKVGLFYNAPETTRGIQPGFKSYHLKANYITD